MFLLIVKFPTRTSHLKDSVKTSLKFLKKKKYHIKQLITTSKMCKVILSNECDHITILGNGRQSGGPCTGAIPCFTQMVSLVHTFLADVLPLLKVLLLPECFPSFIVRVVGEITLTHMLLEDSQIAPCLIILNKKVRLRSGDIY